MQIGKIPEALLRKLIRDKITPIRNDVMVRPAVGEDCAAVAFGDLVCVLSTDPITGAKKDIGRLSVHIACNDIASCGVAPLGLMVTLLAPPDVEEADIEMLMEDVYQTAVGLGVDILGGHTEITDAVNRYVISTTVIGKCLKSELITTGGAKPGDDLIMTKYAGLEGTAIIANDRESELTSILTPDELLTAKQCLDSISVVEEGVIGGKLSVNAMHDVTEGGLEGAVWELCEASSCGVLVDQSQIKILPVTTQICKFFNIDPLRLISSGSMLISTSHGEDLINALVAEDVPAAVIGRMMKQEDGRFMMHNNLRRPIRAPVSDELYKLI